MAWGRVRTGPNRRPVRSLLVGGGAGRPPLWHSHGKHEGEYWETERSFIRFKSIWSRNAELIIRRFMKMKKLRVGVVGCGGIANAKHLPAMKKNGNFEIVAFCDLIEEKALKA